MSCSGCNDSMDTHTNGAVQSNIDFKNMTGVASSNTERSVEQNLKMQEPLRGDRDKLKELRKTLETKEKKGFQSIVENLRGDLGVKKNQSTDLRESKQRKSDILMNANES